MAVQNWILSNKIMTVQTYIQTNNEFKHSYEKGDKSLYSKLKVTPNQKIESW